MNVIQGEKMSEDVKKSTAKSRTLPLWVDVSPSIEMEEISTQRKFRFFDPEEMPVEWSLASVSNESGTSVYQCRLARFRNGGRGLQLVKHQGEVSNPSFVHTTMFSKDEFHTLARAVFRESVLLKNLYKGEMIMRS